MNKVIQQHSIRKDTSAYTWKDLMNLSNFNLKFEDAKEFTVFGEEVHCDEIKVTIKNEANKFVQELYLLSILLKGEEVKQVIGGKRLIEKAVEVFLNSDYVCDNIIYA